MASDTFVEKIVKLVFQLSDELTKISGITSQDLFPLLPDREGREPFLTAKPIANNIFSLIENENPEMLSDVIIMSSLICDVAAIRLQIQISDSELETIARKTIGKLLGYQASRDVDIPLISLQIGDNPNKFGPITFYKLTPEDINSEWWSKVRSPENRTVNNYLLSFARVNVKGDTPTSIKKAKTIVKEGLLILRGICFPISSYEKHQFGIINEFPFWKNIQYRNSNPIITERIDAESELITEIGPFLTSYRLQEDLLRKIPDNVIKKFLELLDKVGFVSENIMQRKVLTGFRWIGEATQPDSLSARYVKLAFALESFIGGEPENSNSKSNRITATLSRRGSTLLGTNLESQKRIEKEIREFYYKRSRIVHGVNLQISSEEFENFGKIVREIGWSLVEKIEILSTIDDLQKWVSFVYSLFNGFH